MAVSPASPRFDRILNRDPRLLPAFRMQLADLAAYYSPILPTNDGVTNFWDIIDENGGYVVAGAGVDTYYTAIDVSGSGFLINAISGVPDAAGSTTTFRITVDGAEYEIALTDDSANANRFVLGQLAYSEAPDGTLDVWERPLPIAWNTTSPGDIGPSAPTTGTDGGLSILSPQWARANPFACLRFNASLKVEVKNSAGFATANFGEQRNGVFCAFDR